MISMPQQMSIGIGNFDSQRDSQTFGDIIPNNYSMDQQVTRITSITTLKANTGASLWDSKITCTTDRFFVLTHFSFPEFIKGSENVVNRNKIWFHQFIGFLAFSLKGTL